MATLAIAQIGHPVLLTCAAPVAEPNLPAIQRLIDDMIETLNEARGLGLAAPQVHTSLRIILARPATRRGEAAMVPPLVLVNPEIEPIDEECESGLEGCLSIPRLRGMVPRYRRLRWRGRNRHGEAVQGEAEGLFARILQHEVDHLEGILFLMRMPDLRYLALEDQVERLLARLTAERER